MTPEVTDELEEAARAGADRGERAGHPLRARRDRASTTIRRRPARGDAVSARRADVLLRARPALSSTSRRSRGRSSTQAAWRRQTTSCTRSACSTELDFERSDGRDNRHGDGLDRDDLAQLHGPPRVGAERRRDRGAGVARGAPRAGSRSSFRAARERHRRAARLAAPARARAALSPVARRLAAPAGAPLHGGLVRARGGARARAEALRKLAGGPDSLEALHADARSASTRCSSSGITTPAATALSPRDARATTCASRGSPRAPRSTSPASFRTCARRSRAAARGPAVVPAARRDAALLAGALFDLLARRARRGGLRAARSLAAPTRDRELRSSRRSSSPLAELA